jgi:hypothetical protein
VALEKLGVFIRRLADGGDDHPVRQRLGCGREVEQTVGRLGRLVGPDWLVGPQIEA